jgi:hypothetical protein
MQDERDKDAGTAIRLVSSGRGDARKGGFSSIVKCTVPEQAAEGKGARGMVERVFQHPVNGTNRA